MGSNNNSDLLNKEHIKGVYISCKDHTVSGEGFDLLFNKQFELLVTTPQPSLEKLGSYYESEDYISHTDANRSVFDKVYQLVKKYSINKKVKLVEQCVTVSNNERAILDIGCGTGDFLVKCKERSWQITGVEPSSKARNISVSKLGDVLLSDISEISENKYDCITMWHVLEHVPNLLDYISSLRKLLKPNGVLIIAVPNYNSYDAIHYKQFWAAYDAPRHLWHFSKRSIELLFSREEMIVKKTLPMFFDSFYVSLLSAKYTKQALYFVRAFVIGCISNLKALFSGEYSSLIYVIKTKK